jgi:hypothetical protein
MKKGRRNPPLSEQNLPEEVGRGPATSTSRSRLFCRPLACYLGCLLRSYLLCSYLLCSCLFCSCLFCSLCSCLRCHVPSLLMNKE